MTASAAAGVFVALGVVLALLVVSLRVLQRFAPAAGAGRARLPLEVVQRVSLGPKQGVAVVRVGARVLVVGTGEGGLHALAELDGSDRDHVLGASTAVPAVALSAGAHAAVERAAGRAGAADAPAAGAPAPDAVAPNAVAPNAAGRRAAAAAFDVLKLTLAAGRRFAVVASLAALGAGPLAAQAPAAQGPAAQAPAVPAAPGAGRTPAAPAPLTPAPLTPAAPARAAAPSTLRPPTTAPQTPPPAPGFAARPPSGTAAAPPSAVPSVDTMVARLAPTMDVRVGGPGQQGLRLSGTVGVVVMLGLLTLLPTLVLMMTGFTRILVVLHFLKQALGTQTAPPNHLVAGLALLLTGFVMAPTARDVHRDALEPWMAGRIEQVEMLERGSKPLRAFMLRQTRERDLETFVELSRASGDTAAAPGSPEAVPLVVLTSAFVTSELRTAFQLGFALFLPFIIIDVVVSAVLMSMGMMMLPPAMIALPFKLLLFVLVDGWTLVVQSLVQSFR